MKSSKKLKFRLTLYFSSFITTLGLIFSFFFSSSFFKFTNHEFENKILQDALILSHELEEKNQTGLLPNLPGIDKSRLYQLVSTEGKILIKSILLTENNTELKSDFSNSPDSFYFTDLHIKSEFFRVITIKLSSGNIFHYGISKNLIEAQKNKIFYLNLFGLPMLFLLIAGFSYFLINKALKPIKIMNETMNSIVSKNLSIRIPPIKMFEEIESLSVSINDLLERLEKSFQAQEHFVANASHQLYTPLAIMKGELEVLQSKERGQEEIQKFHQSLRQELERMVDLVKNLLLISRIEAGHEESFKMRPMRLDDMMISTISRMKLKAKEKNITIKLDFDENIDIEELMIHGERQLLSSLFENLIDNSIKYSPENSTILVKIKKEAGVIISVQDEGPGIKPHELASILEKRFQRGTMTLMPGTGIGLSIAYKIASHHKAKINYQKLDPAGSLFSVHF
jgi:hypothetical protein